MEGRDWSEYLCSKLVDSAATWHCHVIIERRRHVYAQRFELLCIVLSRNGVNLVHRLVLCEWGSTGVPTIAPCRCLDFLINVDPISGANWSVK